MINEHICMSIYTQIHVHVCDEVMFIVAESTCK